MLFQQVIDLLFNFTRIKIIIGFQRSKLIRREISDDPSDIIGQFPGFHFIIAIQLGNNRLLTIPDAAFRGLTVQILLKLQTLRIIQSLALCLLFAPIVRITSSPAVRICLLASFVAGIWAKPRSMSLLTIVICGIA